MQSLQYLASGVHGTFLEASGIHLILIRVRPVTSILLQLEGSRFNRYQLVALVLGDGQSLQPTHCQCFEW